MRISVRHVSRERCVIKIVHVRPDYWIERPKIHPAVTPGIARLCNLVVSTQCSRRVAANKVAAAPAWLIQCLDNLVNSEGIAGRERKTAGRPSAIVRVSDRVCGIRKNGREIHRI